MIIRNTKELNPYLSEIGDLFVKHHMGAPWSLALDRKKIDKIIFEIFQRKGGLGVLHFDNEGKVNGFILGYPAFFYPDINDYYNLNRSSSAFLIFSFIFEEEPQAVKMMLKFFEGVRSKRFSFLINFALEGVIETKFLENNSFSEVGIVSKKVIRMTKIGRRKVPIVLKVLEHKI